MINKNWWEKKLVKRNKSLLWWWHNRQWTKSLRIIREQWQKKRKDIKVKREIVDRWQRSDIEQSEWRNRKIYPKKLVMEEARTEIIWKTTMAKNKVRGLNFKSKQIQKSKRLKNETLRIESWNFQTLWAPGKIEEAANQLNK